ncbi:YkvA family protein [Peribacillus alkalitolerans]|uniref:YkvA family protein n=1 Tax=Peribacillus alkalitolerans TaxID=1550385 RepID=UPI0013D253ED|nr:YkvA family protein [Peribacillus alkalitolerans]
MLNRLFFTKLAFSMFKNEAEKYSNNKDEAQGLLTKAANKAEKNQLSLKGFWSKLQLLFQLLKSWTKGEYKEIPYRTLVMMFAGLVYFVSPIDIVPDFLMGLGLLDDAAVIAFIVKQVDKDLVKFSEWKSKTSNTINAPIFSETVEN